MHLMVVNIKSIKIVLKQNRHLSFLTIPFVLCLTRLSVFVSLFLSKFLTKNKIIRSKQLAKYSGFDRVHGSWLQIDEDGAGHILFSYKLKSISLLFCDLLRSFQIN